MALLRQLPWRRSALGLLLAWGCAGGATPMGPPHEARHFPEALTSLPHPAQGWSAAPLLGASAADADGPEAARGEISVLVAVRHGNEAFIERELERVSDPRSPSYGRHWRLDDGFAEALGARGNAALVQRWLREEGGATRVEATLAGDFVRAWVPVSRAERLFGVRLQAFRHAASGVARFAAAAAEGGGKRRYSIPASLASAVDFVSGFELPRQPQPRPSPATHAARHGAPRHRRQWDEQERESVGQVKVLFTEARDRAFQVHVSVLSDAAFIRRVCQGPGAGAKGCPVTKEGAVVPVSSFDAVLTPVRLAGAVPYLDPVDLSVEVSASDCTASPGESQDNKSGQQLACVVSLGPSLHLLNFASTRLKLRAAFADGSRSLWDEYASLVYPALSTTVSDMWARYHVPRGYRSRSPKSTQAVANFMNISASVEDAQLFHLAMGMRRQPEPRWVGASAPPGVEGNIDLQWVQAMGDNVPTTFWLTPGGYDAHEPFLEWLAAVANATDAELVHSVSYGESEEDYTEAYERRANLELAKLGLRGITVLVATGDTGVQGGAQAGGSPPRCAPFAAVWPASSPYVTAVGGTQISNHVSNVCNVNRVYAMGTESSIPFACPEMSVGEIVCSVERGAMITGGGGFSERFARPRYQEKAVEEYLSQAGRSLNRSLFNASGRAYPDISAVSQNVPIFFQGQLLMVGGTSSASPIVAGLVSLLNGERLAAGKPPLGFLNPLLYSVYDERPEIVQDVLTGNNSGGNMLLPPELNQNCEHGFPALPGWDATTGLGSPHFSNMLKYLLWPESWRSSTARTGDDVHVV